MSLLCTLHTTFILDLLSSLNAMTAKGQRDGAFSFLPMDLSGKLILKARLGDDVRKIPVRCTSKLN